MKSPESLPLPPTVEAVVPEHDRILSQLQGVQRWQAMDRFIRTHDNPRNECRTMAMYLACEIDSDSKRPEPVLNGNLALLIAARNHLQAENDVDKHGIPLNDDFLVEETPKEGLDIGRAERLVAQLEQYIEALLREGNLDELVPMDPFNE